MSTHLHTAPLSPRPGRLEGALIVLTTILLSGFLFHVLQRPTALTIDATLFALLFIATLICRWPQASGLALFALLGAGWAWSEIWPVNWPFAPVVPFAVWAGITYTIVPLHRYATWVRPGILDRVAIWLIVVTALISSISLISWFLAFTPDLGRFTAALPGYHPLVLILSAAGFALLNAALEESIYRGILLHALDAALGAGALSVILQAAVFGAAHFRGVPEGWVGVGMATVYGLMLGGIRRRTRGLLAPFIAHVFADIAVFCIVVLWVA